MVLLRVMPKTIFKEDSDKKQEARAACTSPSVFNNTLQEPHQRREILRSSPTMAVNPSLAASRQRRIPPVPSPFGSPVVDRDVLPPTLAPTDPRQFFLPSQFGLSVLPNANMPSMLSSCVCSGWGILPPASIRPVTRRNEMIQRPRTSRTEMEMYAIYQQRRMEKVNPGGLGGLGVPFLYGSRAPAGPAIYHGRSMFPASDPHLHRSTLRNLQGNPALVATRTHFIESWSKHRQLRRGTRNQKPLDSETESSESQAEEKVLNQMHASPYEEDEHAKDPGSEARHSQKPSKTNEKPTTGLANLCGVLQPTHGRPWGAPATPLPAKAWGRGKEKATVQGVKDCGEKNRLCCPVPQASLLGTHALVTTGGNLSLHEDIQKWTVGDVHSFIRSLPGCSDYAQVFKDHAIDGETLLLLTEEHLRSTMGLKLGPALKIQSQVSQHVGSMLYEKTLSVPTHTRQTVDQPADTAPLLNSNFCSETLTKLCSQDTVLQGSERDSVRN